MITCNSSMCCMVSSHVVQCPNNTSCLESRLTAHKTVELVCRWNAVWDPVARLLLERLPGQFCEGELDVSGLEKLPILEIAMICNWLIEKVHGLCSMPMITVIPQDAEQQVCTCGQLSLSVLCYASANWFCLCPKSKLMLRLSVCSHAILSHHAFSAQSFASKYHVCQLNVCQCNV